MAKKVRKPRSSSPRTYAQSGQPGEPVQPAQPAQPAATAPVLPPTTSRAVAPSRPARTVDLAAEYKYVGKDLRRLFLVAAIMLVLLIAINLVMTFVL